MENRHACLMANHGAVAAGESLDKAMWRMVELETLAKSYSISLTIGQPHILTEAEIDEVLQNISHYGLQDK